MSRQRAALALRSRLLQVVAKYPGLHVRELARILNRSQPLVDYHVTGLCQAGLLRGQRVEHYLRLYPISGTTLTKAERELLGLLRGPRTAQIVLWILLRGAPARNADVAAGTGIGKSLASFHLAKLVKSGLLRRSEDGYVLEDAKLVKRLLSYHPPTPGLEEEFSDLWQALYDA